MAKVGQSKNQPDSYTLDSGASRHMVTTQDVLSNVKTGVTHEVYTANNEVLTGNVFGDLSLDLATPEGDTNQVMVQNVLVVRGLS